LGKICANIRKIAVCSFILQNGTQNESDDVLLGGHVLSNFFRASLRKFGQKFFAPPKISVLLHLGDKKSDRSSKPSFAVSRNLKNAKYHFIEAEIDKLKESSDITDSDTTQESSDILNSVSSSTWLCVTFNTKSTSRKTCQTSLSFVESLQIRNLKRKSGGTWHITSPHLKKWRDTSSVSPTKLHPCLEEGFDEVGLFV